MGTESRDGNSKNKPKGNAGRGVGGDEQHCSRNKECFWWAHQNTQERIRGLEYRSTEISLIKKQRKKKIKKIPYNNYGTVSKSVRYIKFE